MGSKIADVFRIKAIRKCVVGRRMSAYKLIKEYHSNYDNEDETTSEGGIILDNEGE